MQVQIVDERPPLSVVISLAKKANEPALAKWREEMSAMSAEVARKYFGTLTEEVVRDGVLACINLLSLGLLRSSSGAIEPAAWLETFRALGVRGVSRLAVELIKARDALPEYAVVFAPKEAVRPSHLVLWLAYAAKAGAARAYTYLIRETAERIEIQRQIELAEWLFAHTASGRIARRNMDQFFGFGDESPEAEVAIHHIVLLACGLAKVDSYSESAFNEEGPDQELQDLQVTRLAPKPLAAARQRYEELVEKIPRELRAALIFRDQTWFERYVVATKPAKAKAAEASPAETKPKKPKKKKGQSGK